jgi:hypothetical protein
MATGSSHPKRPLSLLTGMPSAPSPLWKCRWPGYPFAWAKLMARVGEEFPLECPGCGGDIRLIAFITDPGPIRKILTHLGEPLEPPPVSPARGPPTDWGELVQVHDDRAIFQGRIDELPVIDIHSL